MIRHRARPACALGATLLIILVAACAADSLDEAGDYPGANGGSGGTGTGTATGVGLYDAGIDAPEEELESSFRSPVATGKYVWIANPASGRVAYIDAANLQIEVVDAGNAPTYLAAIPDPSDDVAIVLNVLSLDATVLRASESGLTAFSLPVPSSGNAWAVSTDGRWATAWTDARALAEPDPIDGYQDITVLDLSDGAEQATALSVGYRPVALAYDEDGTRLFAVTQDGITIVGLDSGTPLVIKNVALTDDPLEDVNTRDVSITPDGELALVRRDGEATVNVFSLSDDSRTDVVLPGPVTDLDLSVDGSVAVAVVRESSQVALLRIPEIAVAPDSFSLFEVEGTVIGSVALAAASPTAFLYTNAVASPVLTVFDSSMTTPEPRSILLHSNVQAVFPTADGSHALVTHHELGSGSSYPSAFSLVPVAAQLPSKIQGLEAPPVSIAVAPDGQHALIATGDALNPAYRMVVARMPSLQIESFELASEPISAGIVAGANRGYVAQTHPDGRITFIDFGTGELRTVTGFELATQVVNGSKP